MKNKAKGKDTIKVKKRGRLYSFYLKIKKKIQGKK